MNKLQNIKQKLTFRRLSGFLIGFAVIGLISLFQLVSPGFSLNHLLEPHFYLRLLYRILLIVLVYQAVINLRYDKEYQSERVQNAKLKYKAAVKLKDVSFRDFLKEYNHKLKIDAWCDKIDKQINKYNKKMADGRNIKKNSAIVEDLEKLKEPEYTEKYWDTLPVKWNQVFYGDFSLEDSLATYDKKARSEFDRDVSIYSSKQAGKYILVSLFLGIIAVNFVFNGITTAAFWFNLLADIFLVILRVIDAGLQCPLLIDMNYTNVYIYKTDIIAEYIVWMEKNGIEKSKAFKILDYIQSVEVEERNKRENEQNDAVVNSIQTS